MIGKTKKKFIQKKYIYNYNTVVHTIKKNTKNKNNRERKTYKIPHASH